MFVTMYVCIYACMYVCVWVCLGEFKFIGSLERSPVSYIDLDVFFVRFVQAQILFLVV